MEQKHDNRYGNLNKLAQDFHEKRKKRLKASGIVLVLLPVVLGLIRWLTDSDKFVFLLIWILCMFALPAYLVSMEYLDEVIQNNFDLDAAEDAEEGEDE